MDRRSFALSCALLFCPFGARAQNSGASLNNDAIIEMLRSGQASEQVIQAILSQPGRYSLGLADINAMQRRAMIPRQVLSAMFDVSNGLQEKRAAYASLPTLHEQINPQDGLPYLMGPTEDGGYIEQLRGQRRVAATSNNLIVRQMLTDQLTQSGLYDVILDHKKAEIFVEVTVNQTRQLREGPRFGTMFDPLRTPTESSAEHAQLNVFRYIRTASGMITQRRLYSAYKMRPGGRLGGIRQNPIDLVIGDFLAATRALGSP
jgi:hypothetical protein